MNIVLTPELEKFTESQVQSGRYKPASEVVGEALRMLEEKSELAFRRRTEIREQIEEAWQSAERGEFVDGKTVFDRIDAELEALEHSAPK